MNKNIKIITTATGGINNLTSKMLNYTLKYNLDKVNDIIIATDFSSPEIEDVCNKYNIKYIKTNNFYANGAPFDKGKVISEILKNETDGWILHMDCDILLPNDFVTKINNMYLDKNILYGARRIMFKTLNDAEEWFLNNKNPEDLSDEIPYGYCWGYFQLFNMQSLQILNSEKSNIYPSSGHVGDSDGWFRSKWGVMIEKSYKKGQFFPTRNDLIIMGNIIELPFLVGHLGVSSVNNKLNINFFNDQ